MDTEFPLPTTQRIQFRHDVVEDRLVLLCEQSDGTRLAVLFTRRFTGELLRISAGILERLHNQLQRRAPQSAQPQPSSRAIHRRFVAEPAQTTVSPPATVSGAQEQGIPLPPLSFLPVTANLRWTGQHFKLLLRNRANEAVTVPLTREDLHRLLDRIVLLARQAHWRLDCPDWLA